MKKQSTIIFGALIAMGLILAACTNPSGGGGVDKGVGGPEGILLADFKADGSFIPTGTTWTIIDEGAIDYVKLTNLRSTLNIGGVPYGITLVFSKVTELAFDSDATKGTFMDLPPKVTVIKLPEAKTVGGGAFVNIASLISVDLPKATTIDDYAFNGCTGLTSLNIPMATMIGESAFSGSAHLTSISLPEATEIGGYAFSNTGLTSVTLPKATRIGEFAFSSSANLTDVTLPEATTIGEDAFNGSANLTSVSLPKVTMIDGYAFFGCVSLKVVNLATGHSGDLTVGDNLLLNANPSQIDLTLGSGVTGVSGNQWKTYSFKSITQG